MTDFFTNKRKLVQSTLSFVHEDQNRISDLTSLPSSSPKKAKPSTPKNSPRNTQSPAEWSASVWEAFSRLMVTNQTKRASNGVSSSYFTAVRMCLPDEEAPPALQDCMCHYPTGAGAVMVCLDGQEYQRPLHRLRFLLKMRQMGLPLDSAVQASHLCMNRININGKGERQCNQPDHMVAEDDATNKARQRCAGWIWIHPYDGHEGGYWYPTCLHGPEPCLRYTPKTSIPTQLKEER